MHKQFGATYDTYAQAAEILFRKRKFAIFRVPYPLVTSEKSLVGRSMRAFFPTEDGQEVFQQPGKDRSRIGNHVSWAAGGAS